MDKKKAENVSSKRSQHHGESNLCAFPGGATGSNGLDFTFKGGTSLLLILPEPKRFSIDIDIITLESRERVEAALTAICKNGIFTKWDLDVLRS